MGGRFSTPAGRAALGGVLAAGSLAALWLACALPSGRLGVTAAAGLFPLGAVLLGGRGTGLLCWGASGLLGLLVLPDKGVALAYLCFLGLYPVAKSRLEGLKSRGLEWLGKLAVFNAALTLLWFGFRALFLPSLPGWLGAGTGPVYLGGNCVFLLYDVGLSRLIAGVLSRLGPGGGPKFDKRK